jgi:hypothetical protein
VSGLTTNGATAAAINTGISSTQAIWLTGYYLEGADGLVAIQSVYISEAGGTWWASVLVLALESAATSAGVRVFYTYTA